MKVLSLFLTLYLSILSTSAQSNIEIEYDKFLRIALDSQFTNGQLAYESINGAVLLAEKIQNDSILFDAYLLQGLLQVKLGLYQEALMTYRHSEQYAHEFKKRIAIKLNMTSALLELDSLDKALEICKEGLKEITEISDSIYIKDLSVVFNYNIGSIYATKGETKKAITSILEAEKLARGYNNKRYFAGIYSELGNLFESINDFNNSIKYFKNATLFLDDKDEEKSIIYINIANSYLNTDSINLSLSYFNQSLKIAENPKRKVEALRGIAGINYYQNNLELARSTLEQALIYSSEATSKDYAICQVDLGYIFFLLGEKSKGINLAEEGYSNLRSFDDLNARKLAIQKLLDIKLKQKPDDSLSEFFKEYRILSDSVSNVDVINAVQDYREQYETQKKEVENERLSRKVSEQNLEILKKQNGIQRRNFVMAIFGLLSLFLGSVGISYYRRNQISKKHNKALTEKNQQISLLNKEIEHRTANHLKTMMSLIESDIENSKDNVIQSALFIQQHRLQVISSIHAQLQNQEGDKEILLDKYLKELCHYLAEFYSGQYESLIINFQSGDIENYRIDALDATNLGLIVNELFTNAMKYAIKHQQDHVIDILLARKEGELLLTVKDNGKGIKIEEKREGAKGLELVRDLVDRLNGTFNIKNANGLLCSIQFKPNTQLYATS